MRWNVGEAQVTRVIEHVMPFEVDFFAEATPADALAHAELAPDFVDTDGRWVMALQTFVIEVPGRRILVDTCIGNDKHRPQIGDFDRRHGPFLDNLAAAGFPAESIDTVVCTHLHVDHVGWNTRLVDGAWVPTFGQARYLFTAADIACWRQSKDPLHAAAFADSVQPVLDAGLVDAVSGDVVVAEPGAVRLRPTPGHTPGHTSVQIGEACVITGDVLHHPVQCWHPAWTARGDLDPALARVTRRALLDAAADTQALVLGTHFAGSAAGRVVRTPDGYRFAPQPAA